MATQKNDAAPAPAPASDFDQAIEDQFDVDMMDGLDDMLDSVVEDDSEGWVPKEKGEYVMGVVLKTGEIKSDFSDDGDPNGLCPTVTVTTKTGDKFRVIGYAAVLKRELREKQPMPGDGIIIKYFGEGTLKTGKFAGRKFRNFGVVVRRA